MNQITRIVMFVFGGLCWMAAAALLALFAFAYVTNGAGLQFFSLVSPITVLPSLIHFLAFAAGAFVCFIIGLALCAHGMFPPAKER